MKAMGSFCKRLRAFGRFCRNNKGFTVGLIIVLIAVIMTVFANQLAPNDAYYSNVRDRLKPPFWMEGGSMKYPLGTDALGRCLFSRIMQGIRISFLISFASVICAYVFGITVGMISGIFSQRWLDTLLMRMTDIQMGFPFVVLAICLLTLLSSGPASMILVLFLSSWPITARLVRSSIIVQKNSDYVAAGRALGANNFRIATKYFLRNLIPTTIPGIPVDLASMIILESLLSYMGIGIQPPMISIGSIMADGRLYIMTHWWVTTLPGVAILIIVFAFNLIGDAMQVHFDPKLKKG